MSSETHYEVNIVENLVETRIVRVPKSEATSPQDAANKAYEAWVLYGRCEKQITIDVQDRNYEISGEIYDVEEDV